MFLTCTWLSLTHSYFWNWTRRSLDWHSRNGLSIPEWDYSWILFSLYWFWNFEKLCLSITSHTRELPRSLCLWTIKLVFSILWDLFGPCKIICHEFVWPDLLWHIIMYVTYGINICLIALRYTLFLLCIFFYVSLS